MTVTALGGYASAFSAIMSVLLLLYRLFAALEHLIQQIQTLETAVATLEQKQRHLARWLVTTLPHATTEGGIDYDECPV